MDYKEAIKKYKVQDLGLTEQEASRVLKIPKDNIKRLIDEGKLKKLDKKSRVNEASYISALSVYTRANDIERANSSNKKAQKNKITAARVQATKVFSPENTIEVFELPKPKSTDDQTDPIYEEFNYFNQHELGYPIDEEDISSDLAPCVVSTHRTRRIPSLKKY
jgi:hypothetical protein